MTTLKDIAKQANVSITTVSLIANGRAKDRKIADETIDKVKRLLKKSGYRPNRAARELKSKEQKHIEIAVCFPLDIETGITKVIPRLLSHLQQHIVKQKLNWHVVMESYQNGKICDLKRIFKGDEYDSALIVGTNEQDLKQLEEIDSLIPIVLLDRQSDKYSTVIVSPQMVAQLAVTLLQAQGINEINLVRDTNNYLAAGDRMDQIENLAINSEIKIVKSYESHFTCASGEVVAKKMISDLNFKPVIVESDLTAIGMIHYFNRHDITMPNVLKLLSISVLGAENTAYQTPEISTIDIPIDKVAYEFILLIKKILQDSSQIYHKEIMPKLNLRETFQPK